MTKTKNQPSQNGKWDEHEKITREVEKLVSSSKYIKAHLSHDFYLSLPLEKQAQIDSELRDLTLKLKRHLDLFARPTAIKIAHLYKRVMGIKA